MLYRVCLSLFCALVQASPAISSADQPQLFPGKQSEWNGFPRFDFEVDGKPVLVVAPKEPAEGRPWVWHGEFFGHKPAPDITLLKRGFHIVYLSVPNMLGSPGAVKHWNACYAELTEKHGLAKKVALVGLSRGGLYCYNWAAANPEKVACIYGDAPVCDFKSWPGGKGKGKGSPGDWQLVMKQWGFKDEAEALAYAKNPVDNLAPLAQAKVPLLHVYGDADDVVPWEENTGLIADRYRKLGGEIALIAKKGVGHHPHGLDDSTPIVEFIAKHSAAPPKQAHATPLRGWKLTRTLAAPEAHQAAAADEKFVYAITNNRIARYDRASGKRVDQSVGEATHLNSGFLWERKLLCAHSNYPKLPEQSEIKALDLETMRLTTFKDFGNFGGSLTWAVHHAGYWWCNFARYGKDNAETFLVKLNTEWAEQGRWTYPPDVLRQIGQASLSGGVWREGALVVTDHDHQVLYHLRVPQQGTMLEFAGQETAPFTGQGIAHDPATGGLIGIQRDKLQVVFAEPINDLALRLAGVKFDHYAAAPGYSEGPTWLKGEVFFCSGALLRVAKDKQVHKHLDLGPAGTVLRGDGHLAICDNKYKALLDFAPDGKVGVIADQWEGKPLRSLNDLTIDARGNVYWTDPEGSTPQTPVGSVFRVRPDGRVDRVATGMAFPNGLDVDPASKHLYVIESQSKKILRFALPEDEDLCGPAETFYDLGGSGGDGCAFDAAGNLWVADYHRPDAGTGRITVLSPKAEVLGYLPVPAKVVSNIAFGGPEHDEIFCTTGDPPGVFHAKVGVKGFAGHPGKAITISRHLNLVAMRPHADADALRQLAKAAAEGSPREQLQALVAKLTDAQVRSDAEKLLPLLEQAAARFKRDQPLLAEIKRLNGKATIEVFAPDWLRSIAGDDALAPFGRIVEINLNERTDGHKEPEAKPLSQRAHDETLKLLAGQDELRRLEVSGTAVTSAGLVHLKDLTNLQFLNVCLTAVDDAGLAHLTKLSKMRRMTVCSSKITGSGFAPLGGMTQLESINLHSSPASDTGLAAMGKLTSLKRLEIVHTHVTDAGLAHVANLVNLRQLHVHGPETTEGGMSFIGKLQELYELDIYDRPASNQSLAEIAKLPKLRMLRLFNGTFDDAGVKHIAGLTTLEELTLNSGKVTDAALEYLADLKRLRKVQLGGTRVTDQGLQRLQSLLPKAEIVK